MPGLPDPAAFAGIAAAAGALALQCHNARRSRSALFSYGIAGAIAVAVSSAVLLIATACPAARAIADLCILLAGVSALALSQWLIFAFRVAGEPDGG